MPENNGNEIKKYLILYELMQLISDKLFWSEIMEKFRRNC